MSIMIWENKILLNIASMFLLILHLHNYHLLLIYCLLVVVIVLLYVTLLIYVIDLYYDLKVIGEADFLRGLYRV